MVIRRFLKDRQSVKGCSGIDNLVSEWLDSIAGLECWGVSAGGCVGSRFALSIGGKRKRITQIKNPSLPVEQRLFDAEYVLSVGCAPWTVLRDNSTVATSDYDCSPDGPLVAGLMQLVGTKVRVATVNGHQYDLEIEFEPGRLRLQVFAGLIPEDGDGYVLSSPQHIVGVNKDGLLEYEPRVLM